MKINIRWPGTTVSPALRAHVERQVGLALGRFGDGIGAVTVRFTTQEPGKASQCEINVALRIREVRVEHVHADPLRAVEQAAARISERVALALDSSEE
jgi:ribosomal subunit interface protein